MALMFPQKEQNHHGSLRKLLLELNFSSNKKCIIETGLLFNNKIFLIFKWVAEVVFLETFVVNYD